MIESIVVGMFEKAMNQLSISMSPHKKQLSLVRIISNILLRELLVLVRSISEFQSRFFRLSCSLEGRLRLCPNSNREPSNH